MSTGFAPDVSPSQRAKVLTVLAAAVIGISTSAVLVRGMEANPLAIAAWRSAGAALVLAPAIAMKRPVLSRSDVLSILAAGTALALHFTVWFASLELTTVLRSTLLVCLAPLWTALFEWALEGTRPRLGFGIGVAIAILGAAGMVTTASGTASLTGDLLALLGGLLSSAYLIIGRRMRARLPLTVYMSLVCATSAVVLLAAGLLTSTALVGFPPRTWALIALAVAGPQLVGHQGLNYAVRYLPAQTIALAVLLEPVGAAILAAVVLSELPGPQTLAGALVVLIGVASATASQTPAEEAAE